MLIIEEGATPEAAVYQTLGAASVCWDADGVFMDQRAVQLAKELLAYLGITAEVNA